MNTIKEVFNNRELSTLIWLAIFILDRVSSKSGRSALKLLLSRIFDLSIIGLIAVSLLFSTGIVYLLYRLKFWEFWMLKDSWFWFTGTAFVTLLNLPKTSKEPGFFMNILIENLKVILVLEYILNVHIFGFITELILQPIIFILLWTQFKSDNQKVKNFISGIFTLGGLSIFIFSIIDIVNDISEYASSSTLKAFLLPIIFSICFIPWAFVVALYMNYEQLFKRLEMFLIVKSDLRYARLRVFIKCQFSLDKIRKMSSKINVLHHGSTREQIRKVIT